MQIYHFVLSYIEYEMVARIVPHDWLSFYAYDSPQCSWWITSLLYYTINNCYLRYVRFTRSILENLLILIENLMWLAVKIDISIFYKSILYIETDTCVIL